MRLGWLAMTVRAVVIGLLVIAILAITAATLMPAIYRSQWFQTRYVHAPN
mgnify:CR=1 FL=1